MRGGPGRRALQGVRTLSLLILGAGAGIAADPLFDMGGYRPQPGLEAIAGADSVVLEWEGEAGQELRAELAVARGAPLIRELSVRRKGGGWAVLGRDLVPEFRVTAGVRRTGHGLPEENRWDVFWDAPLNRPEEVRRASASFETRGGAVRTDGARLEVSFPGLSMGPFSGSLRFTVYRGANLLRQEAIARTSEPSVAYIYQAGLRGLSTELLPRVAWTDAARESREAAVSGSEAGREQVLRARSRVAVATGPAGSLAVFPPPHQFFFPRELEVNLGYVWYRREGEKGIALGVRHGEKEEGYNQTWIDQVFPLYNAPPGTWQRMAVYYYLSPDGARTCRDSVLAYTHGDRYKRLSGYRTMVTHFHTAFTMELLQSGSLDTTPPWIPLMRELGVEIAHIFDFHGDGHPDDPGPVRLKELEAYFEACRRHSGPEFLVLPGEEANVYLGGHYNVLFPRPVYWTHVRAGGAPFVEEDPQRGKVYHTGSAEDVFELARREGALVWQTHPRTKGSTGYPDKIRDADYLKSDRWLGAGWKAMPVDLSQRRLGEVRCFGTLDDMNNWAGPKCLVGEVDTYKKFPDYDLYGDFNVNYVKLERIPGWGDFGPILRALRAGEFFVTTGEVLIPEWSVGGSGAERRVVADVEWTFPLELIEAVWGDGERVGRREVPATDLPPFGSRRFSIPFDGRGLKWVRFAAWDSAGNGAFTQPLRLN